MRSGIGGFLIHALVVTGLVLGVVFVLNRFQVTRNLVQTAIG
jgi:hypothetical protein